MYKSVWPLNKYLSQRKDYLDRVWAGHVLAGYKTELTNLVLIILAECVFLIQSVSLLVFYPSLWLFPHTFFFPPWLLSPLKPAPSSLSSSPLDSVSVLVASPECGVSNQAVCGCLSHINSQPWGVGVDGQSTGEERGRLVTVRWMSDWCVHIFAHIYWCNVYMYTASSCLVSVCKLLWIQTKKQNWPLLLYVL